MTTLEEYLAQYRATRPSDPVLTLAAAEEGLATEDLFAKALVYVQEEAENEIQDLGWFALLVLQRRVCPGVLGRCFELLEHPDPEHRELALRVLREFPGLDFEPKPFAPEIVARLADFVEKEKDWHVLEWALAAIGWQRIPAGGEVLRRFVSDSRADIRDVVANNLFGCLKDPKSLTREEVHAIRTLIADEDPRVQWSIIYDVAEWVSETGIQAIRFRQAIQAVMPHAEDDVQEQAERALAAIQGVA